MKGALLWWASALLANIRRGRKGLAEANTLAYRAHLKVTKKINSYELGPGTIFTTLYFVRNFQIGTIS